MLARDANVNAANARGMTAVMFAASRAGGAPAAAGGGGGAMNTWKFACVAVLVALFSVPLSPQSKPAEKKETVTAADSTLTQDIDSREYFSQRPRSAWRYGEQFYRSSSGLVAAVPFYDYATAWDLASGLSRLYCARELGFIDDARYKQRVTLALQTIAKLKLFDGVAFNKFYKVSNGAMVNRYHKPSTRGIGWSVTDLGRLIVWLRIIANRDPDLLPPAEAVVNTLNYSRLVKDSPLTAGRRAACPLAKGNMVNVQDFDSRTHGYDYKPTR
jgi:hypothetical protein